MNLPRNSRQNTAARWIWTISGRNLKNDSSRVFAQDAAVFFGNCFSELSGNFVKLFHNRDKKLRFVYICFAVYNELSEIIINQYQNVYPELGENRSFILEQLQKEYVLFSKTLDSGLKKAVKYLSAVGNGGVLSGELAFKLYDTCGFPIEFLIMISDSSVR